MVVNDKRALAHIEKVTNIRPIPNADRIEQVSVLGWNLVTKKGEFADGDLCVYIEIDSRVPSDMECFKFLEDRNYKVKTIKLRKVISQGLALPISILPKGNYSVGQDVTDILKITKIQEDYDPAPISLEMKLKAHHKKLTQNRIFKKLMKYGWFRKFAFSVLIPKKKKNGWPNWVKKTDQERVQNMPWILCDKRPFVATEKCLDGSTLIRTMDGYHSISEIVNNRLPVMVASYNTSNHLVEYKKILDYHKVEQGNLDHYKIGVGVKGKGNRPKFIKCTENHKFFVNGKWIDAKDIKVGDSLYHFSTNPPNEILEMLLGCLIGDSSITYKGDYLSVNFGHSEKQIEYLKYKKRLLGRYTTDEREYISGYGSRVIRFITKTNLYIEKYVKENCLIDRKKSISKQWAYSLTPISLAFWYMDDGSLRNRENDSLGCRMTLNTQSYSYNECELLRSALFDKFNIETSLGDKNTYKGYVIILDVNNTKKFASLISPYVCSSMKYKLPKEYEELPCIYEDWTFDYYDGVISTPVLSIENLGPKAFGKYMYDITVEDNSNYFANSVLVHNCDGTSTSFTLKNRPFRKPEFIVCSRNVVQDTPNKKCFYDSNVYWEIAKKYDIENVLKKLIGKNEWITLQGETIGEKIQKNKYNIKDVDFYAFDLITSNDGVINGVEASKILKEYGIKWVPFINTNYILPDTIDALMKYSTGESELYPTLREGIVFRNYEQGISFKCVSNDFLIKWGL